MNLILTVLEITAPVFLLAGLGFAWVKLGFEYSVEFVTRLAMTVSIPALIFVALMTTQIDPSALSLVVVAATAAHFGVLAVFWGISIVTGMDRATHLPPLVFGNTGNLGLPLALFAFGPEGLSYAVVVFAVSAIFVFTVGIWLVSGGGAPWKLFKEPMLIATLLGAVFCGKAGKRQCLLPIPLSYWGKWAFR